MYEAPSSTPNTERSEYRRNRDLSCADEPWTPCEIELCNPPYATSFVGGQKIVKSKEESFKMQMKKAQKVKKLRKNIQGNITLCNCLI